MGRYAGAEADGARALRACRGGGTGLLAGRARARAFDVIGDIWRWAGISCIYMANERIKRRRRARR